MSRLVQLIDAAENRSARERSIASDIIELGGNVIESAEMPSLYSEEVEEWTFEGSEGKFTNEMEAWMLH